MAERGFSRAPRATYPQDNAPARGCGCATFTRASATRAALSEKNKIRRPPAGRVPKPSALPTSSTSVPDNGSICQLTSPKTAEGSDSFCSRSIARRPGCQFKASRRRRRENQSSIEHGREPPRACLNRCVSPRDNKRDTCTCRQ